MEGDKRDERIAKLLGTPDIPCSEHSLNTFQASVFRTFPNTEAWNTERRASAQRGRAQCGVLGLIRDS